MNAMTGMYLYRHLDEMAPWNDRLQVLEVAGVVDEGPDVKTFTFRSDAQTWFRYKPGQFITLELPTVDGPLMRTYTLFFVSPVVLLDRGHGEGAARVDRYAVDVRQSETGFAHQGARPRRRFHASQLRVRQVLVHIGRFRRHADDVDAALAERLCAVDRCGLRQLRALAEEIIFRKELELLGANMPGLSLGFMIEERSSRESWFGHMGRIDAVRLPLLSPDFHEREVFCCGPISPPALCGACSKLPVSTWRTITRRVLARRRWRPAPADTIQVGEAAPVEAMMSIRFADSDVDSQCVVGQTVLQAARASGVRISAACEFGLCGTCRVKKISGEAEMSHNGGILDEEVVEGYILACCSKPLSALEIEA